ncbi:MAG: HAD family phosphatase [Planctomycetota bacterium]
MPPSFLYFDLGNVLLTFDNDRMCRQMATVYGVSAEEMRQTIFATGDHTDLQWRFEAGQVSEEEYLAQLAERFGVQPDRNELEHAASDIFGPIEATMQLATRLAERGYPLGLLSNTNPFHWRFVLDGRFPVLNSAFTVHATSFAAQSMKPDPVIYKFAVEQAGVDPGDIFFTDDRLENVAGAKAAGFDAVPFTSTEQLLDDLRQRGIEVD